MKFRKHARAGRIFVELQTREVIVENEQDFLDLVANARYSHGADTVILPMHSLSRSFYDLRSGFAGAVLQKASNYRLSLAVIGDVSRLQSRAWLDFIRESNREGRIVFADSLDTAIELLTGTDAASEATRSNGSE